MTRFSAFYFFLFLLSVPVFLFHLKLFLELHYTKDMANLRCSAAEESEDTLNVFISHTEGPATAGRETSLLLEVLAQTFKGDVRGSLDEFER